MISRQCSTEPQYRHAKAVYNLYTLSLSLPLFWQQRLKGGGGGVRGGGGDDDDELSNLEDL